MTFPKIDIIKNLTISELEQEIIKLKKEIFELKIKKVTRQSIKNHLFKHKKYQLAQLLTLETQKNIKH